jgi:hypothetical protein
MRGSTQQGLETQPHRFGVSARSTRTPSVPQQRIVDVERLLHTAKIAMSIWLHQASTGRAVARKMSWRA